MSGPYPYPRWLAVPGDRAVCGCEIEADTGAYSPCDWHEREHEDRNDMTDRRTTWATSKSPRTT